MASPHTAGAVAQMLEMQYLLAQAAEEVATKQSPGKARKEEVLESLQSVRIETASEEAVDLSWVVPLTVNSMTCMASKMQLSINRGEGKSAERITRNLIAQVVHADVSLSAARAFCDVGGACRLSGPQEYNLLSSYLPPTQYAHNGTFGSNERSNLNGCSGHGYCQQGECLCDTGYWGSNCSSTERGFSCSEGLQYIPYTLYDITGSGAGWTEAELRLLGPHLSQGHPSSSSSARMSYLSNLPVTSSSMCGGLLTEAGMCLALVDDPQALAAFLVVAYQSRM